MTSATTEQELMSAQLRPRDELLSLIDRLIAAWGSTPHVLPLVSALREAAERLRAAEGEMMDKLAARASELAMDSIHDLFDDWDDKTWEAMGIKIAEAVVSAAEEQAQPSRPQGNEGRDIVTVIENLGTQEWRVQIGDILLFYGEDRDDAIERATAVEQAILSALPNQGKPSS